MIQRGACSHAGKRVSPSIVSSGPSPLRAASEADTPVAKPAHEFFTLVNQALLALECGEVPITEALEVDVLSTL